MLKNVSAVARRGRKSSTVKIEYSPTKPVKRRKKNIIVADEDVKPATGLEKKAKQEASLSKYAACPWESGLAAIEEMRCKRDAPVDTMGCEVLGDLGENEVAKRYYTLIALMLSSQTKDAVTGAAVHRLVAHGLTPEKMVTISTAKLAELIKPVGFYTRKADYIQRASQIILAQYGGDIPNTLEGLIALPGVGPKMAHICMNVAWNSPQGIGVDVHVHRICNRLGWVHTKTPEETRKDMEDWLPKSYWGSINLLLVGFGQQICTPLRPLCAKCTLKDVCPSSTART